MPSQSGEIQLMHGSSMNSNMSHIIWIMDIIITFVVSPGENIHSTSQHRTEATFTLILVRVTSHESGFPFTARTSFTHTSERSWSLVQGQLNACLPTISRKIESRECFVKK